VKNKKIKETARKSRDDCVRFKMNTAFMFHCALLAECLGIFCFW